MRVPDLPCFYLDRIWHKTTINVLRNFLIVQVVDLSLRNMACAKKV